MSGRDQDAVAVLSETRGPLRVALVGAGAFGAQHLYALARIEDAEVECVVDTDLSRAGRVAETYGIARTLDSVEDVLADDSIDAVVLATPSDLHADQAVEALLAGKHALVEIPIATSRTQLGRLEEAARESGRLLVPGHVRRHNPPQIWLADRIDRGELKLQHLVVETFFWRRTNVDLHGEPRGWTDHLLWHHAAHSVDLFLHLTGDPVVEAHAVQGPVDADLGIALDLSIQLRSHGGALATIGLSFNNDGPQGSSTRFICDHGTYRSRYDELTDGHGAPVDLSGLEGGVLAQDRAFVTAVLGQGSTTSLTDVIPAYDLLARVGDHLLGPH